MTDDTMSPSTSTSSDLAEQLVQATQRITQLQSQLADSVEEARNARRQLVRVQDSLQYGLDQLDEDEAELVKDFLEANTQWEFKLTHTFRVRVIVDVTVEARTESDAQGLADSWEFIIRGDGEPEVDGVTIDEVEEDD